MARYRLDELAQRVGGAVRGDAGRSIGGVNTLDLAGPDELSFFTHPRYRDAARATHAGAVLAAPGCELEGIDLLEVEHPQIALARLLELFHPTGAAARGISPDARLGEGVVLGHGVCVGAFAVVGDGCTLGDGVVVGAGSVLGDGCRVGPGTEIKPRVVLYPGTQLGARCLVHAGVVLGGDGFGFTTHDGRHHKIPQVGKVVVEDDVEIGANTTVDRATIGQTRIGQGSKLDNLVMIAHGVDVGPGALLAAQSGVAGSARLGPCTTLAGQAGVGGHLRLGAGSIVAAKSAVFDDQPDGAFVAGIPAVDHRRWKRSCAVVARLPELRREVTALRTRLAALEERLGREE